MRVSMMAAVGVAAMLGAAGVAQVTDAATSHGSHGAAGTAGTSHVNHGSHASHTASSSSSSGANGGTSNGTGGSSNANGGSGQSSSSGGVTAGGINSCAGLSTIPVVGGLPLPGMSDVFNVVGMIPDPTGVVGSVGGSVLSYPIANMTPLSILGIVTQSACP